MSNLPPWDLKATPMIAVIREDECIGCTKCIPDCPTDAIVGAAKLMHTVVTDVCTGCELCVPTCPVDCIDIVPVASRTPGQLQTLNQQWLSRFEQHNQRQQRDQQEHQERFDKACFTDELDSVEARKQYIADALKRVQRK